MEISNLSISQTNQFASGYLHQDSEIMSFFDYRYGDSLDDQARIKELYNRTFPRETLANHIEHFMSRYPNSTQVKNSLEKLRSPLSAVVIGGQQAGLLTGPLYSIHKIISILKLAEEKEKQLNIPVIPVFWIAGEDHDYHEVNHVYLSREHTLYKKVYPEKVLQKKMISDLKLNQELCDRWVAEVLEDFGEAEFTHKVHSLLKEAIKKSDSFVDFFAYIVMQLFKEKGLLIIDSGNPELRRLESEVLINIIKCHKAISEALIKQQEEITKVGFSKTIDVATNSANLFYYEENFNERLLLEYDPESHIFISKNKRVSFTEAQLLKIASHSPERLSNNVVTRPIMQESLFPTIAFIAGPGEISYWAELKKVFEEFKMKMPPIVPRLNITIIERAIESDINDLGLTIEEVLINGTKSKVEGFFSSVKDTELEEQFSQIKTQVTSQYKLIEEKLARLDRGLLPLLNKNESKLLEQIEFMRLKIEGSIQQKHSNTFNKFNRIENSLRPFGSPQERTWNIFYFLNKYGLTFIDELLNLPLDFDGQHKIIKV